MSNKRDASPLVFVRHPHCFVPASGQNIPPPPNWKPPPLPKDLDDSASVTAHASSTTARVEKSLSNDTGCHSLSDLEEKNTVTPEISLKSNSLRSTSNDSTGVQPGESKNTNNINLVQKCGKKQILPKNDSSTSAVKKSTPLRISQDKEPKENKVAVEKNDSHVQLTATPNKEKISILYDTTAIEEQDIETSSFESHNPPDIENQSANKIDLTIGKTDNGKSSLHISLKKTIEDTEIKLEDFDSNKEVTPKPCKEEMSILEEEKIGECDIYSPTFDFSASNMVNNSTVNKSTNVEKIDNDKNQKEGDLEVNSEGLLKGWKHAKAQQNTIKSICISSLEDELDSLPIPEFPPCSADNGLDKLAMSEFPVPKELGNNEDENVVHAKLEIDSVENNLPDICISSNKKDELNAQNSVDVRNQRNAIRSMDTNLENVTIMLQKTKKKSGIIPQEDQEQKVMLNKRKVNSEEDNKNQETKSELIRKPSVKYKRVSEPAKDESSVPLSSKSDADSLKCRIKNRVTNDRRNSLAKTLTKIESYLLVASSPPEGIRSQRLAELGVSCVVHAATVIGDSHKAKGIISSFSDGIDIINANLEDGGKNSETFNAFSDKIAQVKKNKGVALVISDESSPSINQRYFGFT